jgi:hypothetical protein
MSDLGGALVGKDVTALDVCFDDPKNSPADGTLAPAQHVGPLALLHSIDRSRPR